MKKFFGKKSLIATMMLSVSSSSFGYYCPVDNEGFTSLVQWHVAFYAKWGLRVAPVGNFQMAMNTAERTINLTLDKMERALMTKIHQSDANIEKALNKFTTAVNTQLSNFGTAQIVANTAIEEYDNAKLVSAKINALTEAAEQPITNCMQFAAGQKLSQAFATMQRTANASALDLSQRAVSNNNEKSTRLAEYNDRKAKYVETNDPTIKNGDVNASLLFGSHTGALTRYLPAQDDAAKAFISNIVREYDLPARIGSSQENSVGRKRYTNIQRRLATYLGLAANSLESVRANHQASGELLSFYEAAKLTPSKDAQKYGVSVSEILNTYAEQMIGPENTAAIASAKSNTTVLRQMAQTNAMRLFVKNKKIQSTERLLAMEAAKVALQAEEVLGEQARMYQSVIKQ